MPVDAGCGAMREHGTGAPGLHVRDGEVARVDARGDGPVGRQLYLYI